MWEVKFPCGCLATFCYKWWGHDYSMDTTCDTCEIWLEGHWRKYLERHSFIKQNWSPSFQAMIEVTSLSRGSLLCVAKSKPLYRPLPPGGVLLASQTKPAPKEAQLQGCV